jgi:hypothetical protein
MFRLRNVVDAMQDKRISLVLRCADSARHVEDRAIRMITGFNNVVWA